MQKGDSNLDSQAAGDSTRCVVSIEGGTRAVGGGHVQVSGGEGIAADPASNGTSIEMQHSPDSTHMLSGRIESSGGCGGRCDGAMCRPPSITMTSHSNEPGGDRTLATRAMSSSSALAGYFNPSLDGMATAGSDAGSVSFPTGSLPPLQLPSLKDGASAAAPPGCRLKTGISGPGKSPTKASVAAAHAVGSPLEDAVMNDAASITPPSAVQQFGDGPFALGFEAELLPSPPAQHGLSLTDAESELILGGQARGPPSTRPIAQSHAHIALQ